MILASNPDRAVTVRERDPTYPGNDVPGGPRGALVDEVNGDSICDQIPLPHGHGSVMRRLFHDLLANEVSAEWGPQRSWPHSRKKLQSKDVAVASRPPCSFVRAFGSKNGGQEATATVFGQSSGEFPIQF